MIKKATISNYKSIAPDTVINFDMLTVLVGQNGSGKSNIIDVFGFVSDAMKLGLEGAVTKRNGIKAIRRWTYSKPYNISIELEIEEQDFYAKYAFEIASHNRHEYSVKKEHALIQHKDGKRIEFLVSDQKWLHGIDGLKPVLSPLNLALPIIAGDENFRPLFECLIKMRGYSIYPDTLRDPQKYEPSKPMEEHGNNWVSILKDQKDENDDSWKQQLIIGLKRLTNEIDDIEIVPVSGYLIIRFRHGLSGDSNKPKWFESQQESDGTLRIAGIISALFQKPSLTLIGIEEPELTIHPGAVGLIYDYLIEASAHSQVLITTHSPDLLDYIKDPECIRVVSKKGNETHVTKMKEYQVNIVKDRLYSLGELHRTEGIVTQSELEFPV